MASSSVNLRIAGPKDAKDLSVLFEAMFQEWGVETSAITGNLEASLRRALDSDGKDAVFLIAEMDGSDCGFAGFGEVFEPAFLRPAAFLRDVYVLPVSRRKGVGAALMRRLFLMAEERDWVSIDWHVNRLDFEARTFFEMVAPDGYTVDRLVHRLEGNALSNQVQSAKNSNG